MLSSAAVDEGVVCADATVNDYFQEYLDDLRKAQADGTVTETNNDFDVECDDSSGTIAIADLIRFGLAEIENPWDVPFGGTWTLEGSGD